VRDIVEYNEAKSIVLSFINGRYHNEGDELVILDEDVIEISIGWVFCYNSKRFLESRELVYALAGNAPILFDNRDDTLHVTGTAKPLDDYIEDHLSNYELKSS
jgi:hypothetical protein